MDFLAFVTACSSGNTQYFNLAKYLDHVMSVFTLPGVTQKNICNCIALLRAGYLTMFERRDNAAAVYKEFRQFDNLLTKLARSSLKRGKLHRSKFK